MRVVILGAAGTGKTRLAQALFSPLAETSFDITVIPEAAALQVGSGELQAHTSSLGLTLLMGLDQTSSADEVQRREQADHELRAALQHAGIAFTVLYGSDAQRAAQALRLIRRTSGQPANAPNPDSQDASRWVWVCDKCSDPVCEHRLFTDKISNPGT